MAAVIRPASGYVARELPKPPPANVVLLEHRGPFYVCEIGGKEITSRLDPESQIAKALALQGATGEWEIRFPDNRLYARLSMKPGAWPAVSRDMRQGRRKGN